MKVPQLSLSELQRAFAQWRQTRQPRFVPTELRLNALALLDQHRTGEVLQSLGINHSMLRRWKHQCEAAPSADAEPGFVALPVSVEASSCEAMAEPIPAPLEAAPLRLTIRREAEALALSGELSLAQWRAALSLLEAER